MARTLSVGATAWRQGSSFTYDWLVESEDLGLRWSYDTDTAGGHTWEHRLLSISEIELAVPPGGGLASANTVTITVAESDTGKSLRAIWNDLGRLEGADLTVSLLPAGEAYADRIKFFTGKIDQASWRAGVEPGTGIGTLVAVDNTLHNDIQLPETILTVEAYPNLPTQWHGAILPLIYGAGGFLNIAPLLMLDSTTLLYQVADHPMAMMTPNHALAVAQGTGLVGLAGDATADATAATLTLDRPVTENRYAIAAQVETVSQVLNVTNQGNLLDGNTATLVTIGTTTVNADGDGHGRIAVKYTWTNPDGANAAQVTLFNHRRAAGAAATVTAELLVRVLDATTNAVLRDNLFRDGPYRHQSNPRTRQVTLSPIALVATAALEVELEVLNEGGAGAAADDWEIGGLTLELYFQADTLFYPIYLWTSWDGRPDVDGSITGTPGFVISHPAEVLHSVLVHRLGLPIHSASFAAVKTGLLNYSGGSYRYDFGLGSGGWWRPQLSATVLLDTLAQQAGCYLFPAGDGTSKLAIARGNPTSQLSLTVSTMANVVIELSRLELIHSSYEVRYGWSITLGRFLRVATASPSGSNHHLAATADDLLTMCSDSLDRYGPQTPLIVEAYAIQDTGTADTLLGTLVHYFWTQQVLVTCETTFIAVHLEVGDLIDITHPELPTQLQGTLFEVLRITDHPEAADSRPWPRRLVCRSVGSLTAFDYFLIKDQSGVIWYWWVNRAGELTWGSVPPAIATRIAEDLNLSPIPSWLQLTNPTPTTRYVHPSTLTGDPTVALTVPAVGTGYVGSPVVRGQGVGTWALDVSAAEEVMTVEV